MLLGGCMAADAPEASERRGKVAKADHVVWGSCGDGSVCGGKSTGSCWCDEACASYGDCCEDAADVCGVDECNAEQNTGCHAGETCIGGDGVPANCTEVSCGMQDAHGVGLCLAFWGYKWDGSSCVGISGCSCAGEDCDQLILDYDACVAAHAECGADCPLPGPELTVVSDKPATCAAIHFVCPDGWEPWFGDCGCGCRKVDGGSGEQACGGLAGLDCPEGQYCAYAPEAMCGAADQTGVCAVKPEACIQIYDPVCGCDGRTYGNACMAASSGVSVVSQGECPVAADSCKGNCGGQSDDGSCWCDAYCAYYGDCCDDKQAFCAG